MRLEFRKLQADEIDCRISTASDKGVSILLYKDARVDQNLLDQTVGPLNWQRRHEVIDGNLYCTVSIWDEDKHAWVSKQDVGTESYTEKEKGQASDSFKRACFNWGIGRELYTAPFIWIGAECCKIVERKDGKYVCYDKFDVSGIDYDSTGRINFLTITSKGKLVYQFGVSKSQSSGGPVKPFKDLLINDTQYSTLVEICKARRITKKVLKADFGVDDLKLLTSIQAEEAIIKYAV